MKMRTEEMGREERRWYGRLLGGILFFFAVFRGILGTIVFSPILETYVCAWSK